MKLSEYGGNAYYYVVHGLRRDKVLQQFLSLFQVITGLLIAKKVKNLSISLKMQIGYVTWPY